MIELKEPMQQMWRKTEGGFEDQYGFYIKKAGRYFLFKGDKFLVTTYSLEAAKEISLVLINDRITNG